MLSLVLTTSSSGAKWLTSKVTFQLSAVWRISEVAMPRRRAVAVLRRDSMAGTAGTSGGCGGTGDSNDLHGLQGACAAPPSTLARLPPAAERERGGKSREIPPEVTVETGGRRCLRPGGKGGAGCRDSRRQPSGWGMAGVMVCEPRHLYNIINQYRWRSRLTEPNYLCLLDARSQREFDASHIITAQRIERNPAGEYLIPNPEELDYVRYCVVYDHDTGFLGCSDNQEEKKETGSSAASEPETIGSGSMCSQNTGEGDALHHARNLQHFTRHPVLLLKGGYKHFSACYHFLKSQKTLWMPQELDTFQPYPVEILPEKLYMGNFKQASDKQIQRDLKIKALVNVCEQPVTLFAEEGESLHVSVPDSLEADLFSSFPTISHFIDAQLDVGAVLVFSSLGISRCSTVTMAYLMHSCRFSLQRAWKYLLKCQMNIRPHPGFVEQLSAWETQIYGAPATDISGPNY
uniref:Serine/threonine/tyrosine interacting like 1 n=2 Tax=Corvus moneduloides TaxID=1196302 RepID=A0A8U7N5H4_CORMO